MLICQTSCIVLIVDNMGMGDASFSSSLFTVISTYMNAENC